MYLAYLDPGSGSMLAAAVVAGFAGAMVAVKMWWQRLTGKFRRRPAESATGSVGPAEAAQSAAARTVESGRGSDQES